MVFRAHVLTVFKQQVPCSFIDGFVLFRGPAIFGGSDPINYTAKIGNYMEKIENNFGLRQFFFTALINGSHMSIATASIAFRWPTLNLLKNRFNVFALRSFPTKTMWPFR